MCGVALLGDGLQALLDLTVFFAFAASFVGLVIQCGLLLWLKLAVPGFKIFGGKSPLLKIAAFGGATAVTMIPELDIWPELLASILVMGAQIRFEDSLKDPAFAAKVGMAAKIVGTVQPELAVAAKVVAEQTKKQAVIAQARERQEARAVALREQQALASISA